MFVEDVGMSKIQGHHKLHKFKFHPVGTCICGYIDGLSFSSPKLTRIRSQVHTHQTVKFATSDLKSLKSSKAIGCPSCCQNQGTQVHATLLICNSDGVLVNDMLPMLRHDLFRFADLTSGWLHRSRLKMEHIWASNTVAMQPCSTGCIMVDGCDVIAKVKPICPQLC